MPEERGGGLGILDLRNLNLCLLATWMQRYHDDGSKLWKQIIDCKYSPCSPNIFCCYERNASPFWKRVLLATKAAKMGFRWQVSNGLRIRFWKYQWFRTCSLAIQFWELYTIANELGISLKEA
jgi:hypothetical protein